MILCAHQPNFFPFCGFFQKMRESDIFVILKEPQFEKNNYQNRFNLGDKWHTMSVNRGLEPIKDKKYLAPAADWNKIKCNLEKYRENYIDLLQEFDECFVSDKLYLVNSAIINKIREKLNIKTQLVFDHPTNLTSTDRLIDLCKKWGADTYLSGISGPNYMDMDKFKGNGIKVIIQDEATMIKKPVLEVLF